MSQHGIILLRIYNYYGKKLQESELAFYKLIDKLLYRDWDPIGISELNGPTDEYQGYLPIIFNLALKSSDINIIADYLLKVEIERLGLAGNRAHCLEIAEIIINEKLKLNL